MDNQDHSLRPEHIALERRVERLEYWKNGNGTEGAEARLVAAEELVESVDRLCLPEKFPEVRRMAFDVRDRVVADEAKIAHVESKIAQIEEVAVDAGQLEMFMGRVIHKIDEKLEARPRGKRANLVAFAPYFASICTLIGLIVTLLVTRGPPK